MPSALTTRLRPSFTHLRQLNGHFGGCSAVSRLPVDMRRATVRWLRTVREGMTTRAHDRPHASFHHVRKTLEKE